MNNKILIFLFVLTLSSCYESPAPPKPEFTGIWKAENYDQLFRTGPTVVIMLEFAGDNVNIFLNHPDQAFNLPYLVQGQQFIFDVEFFIPLFRENNFDFDDDGHLSLEGNFFGGRMEFERSDLEDLEAYKQENLLNEYGNWDGNRYAIFFELIRGDVGLFSREGEISTVTLREINGESFIEQATAEGKINLWPYFLKRNEIRVSFPDGIGTFTRRYNDNIIPIN